MNKSNPLEGERDLDSHCWNGGRQVMGGGGVWVGTHH